MLVIRMDQAQPGQVTADRVLNASGGVLVGSGTTLSADHIRRLRTAGVETLAVAGDDAATEVAMPTVGARMADLAARFAGVQDPVLLQIRDAAARQLGAILAAGGK